MIEKIIIAAIDAGIRADDVILAAGITIGTMISNTMILSRRRKEEEVKKEKEKV